MAKEIKTSSPEIAPEDEQTTQPVQTTQTETAKETMPTVENPTTETQTNDTALLQSPAEDAAAKETAEEKMPKRLPVLTIDKEDFRESKQDIEDAEWHFLKNAYITGQVIDGVLAGVETTPKDKKIVGVTYYGNQRVIIPASEFVFNAKELDETAQEKILSSMIGAEISYQIISLVDDGRAVAGSRLMANKTNIRKFYQTEDQQGFYKIYQTSLVEARVIGATKYSVRLEIFGAETAVDRNEVCWDWCEDAAERFAVGDRVMVKILSVENRDDAENIKVKASIKQATENEQLKLMLSMKTQNLYIGKVVGIQKGTYLVQLSNGAAAMAHRSHCKQPVVKGDVVAFVVKHLNKSNLTIMGNITRIIRHG